jgi:hypothetical protein
MFTGAQRKEKMHFDRIKNFVSVNREEYQIRDSDAYNTQNEHAVAPPKKVEKVKIKKTVENVDVRRDIIN